MKIAIIGTGKIGRGFARGLSPRHEVVFGSRDPDRARMALRATGAVDALIRTVSFCLHSPEAPQSESSPRRWRRGATRRGWVMLDQYKPHTTIAVRDLEKAKAWYQDKLGLTPAGEDPGGAWYECAGAEFGIFPTPYAGTAKNTVMEWNVDDVEKVVEVLKDRGVEFDTFEIEGVTWDGPIAIMGGRKGAWFRDLDGNVLAVGQAP